MKFILCEKCGEQIEAGHEWAWNGYRSLCDECYDDELERGLGDE